MKHVYHEALLLSHANEQHVCFLANKLKSLIHAGYNGHYVQPLPPDTDPGSPIDMQAD